MTEYRTGTTARITLRDDRILHVAGDFLSTGHWLRIAHGTIIRSHPDPMVPRYAQ